jgi:predicted nucleic acid-binding protein
MTPLLVVKSAHMLAARSTEVATQLRTWITEGRIATCEMIALEVLYSARSLAEYDKRRAQVESFRWLPTTNTALRRAIDVQHELAQRGQHRRPLPDLIIAATAEDHGATVVHYDKDFELIAEVTKQPTQWVVPAGTL